jgi:DGQHR domain-containing protein
VDNKLVERYGVTVDLGHCIIGRNLNLWVIRGFAPLHILADLSSPDVYDEKLNNQGTQRPLEVKHSKEALKYALTADDVANNLDPRGFPEVILNARDRNVIEVLNIEDLENEFEFDSINGATDLTPDVARVRVRVGSITWPKRLFNPQISRVDGNHRLQQAESVDDDEIIEAPSVPFSLLVGLEPSQERKLFKDINANQKGMESAFLDVIHLDLTDQKTLLMNQRDRALWIAQRLTQQGCAFDRKVFFGGSKVGVKEAYGEVPPIKLNALKGAVLLTLKNAPAVTGQFFRDDLGGIDTDSADFERDLLENAEIFAELLDRYWKAVRNAYPEAWENKKDYILLQSIGLNAFAMLGGQIIHDLLITHKAFEQRDFDAVLGNLSEKFKLNRELYPGIAGAGGATRIFEKAVVLLSQDDNALAIAKKKLSRFDGSELDQ